MTAHRVIRTTLLTLAILPVATAGRSDEPKDAKGYVQRGNEHAEKGEWDKAIKDFDEALRLDPKYANAIYNRARA